jgi:membrane protease YdiL (CAAX protease family)
MFTDGAGRIQPIWAFVLSALLSVVAFLVAGYTAAAVGGDHVLRFEALFRPALALMLLSIFSWLLTVGNHVEDHRIAAQGLSLSPGWARQFGVGCAFGVLLVALAVIPLATWEGLSFRTVLNSRSLARVAVVLAVVISGALAEELMFRGYPFQRLTEGIGPAGAIAVFSVLFGVVHLSNPGATVWGLVNTVAIGVLLSVLYLRTRALWMPWGFHFAWNAMLGIVLGLPVSGLRLFTI